MEPKGKLTFIKCEFTQKNNVAIYADLFFKDEAGGVFRMGASKFIFELIHVPKRASARNTFIRGVHGN